MSDTRPTSSPSRSVTGDLVVDRLCNEFEDAWKAGESPRIEDYLVRVDAALKASLLKELVAIETFQRRRRGDTLPAGDYRQRFPQLDTSVLDALNGPVGEIAVDPAPPSPTLLNIPGNAKLSADSAASSSGVGEYELMEEIARGGMGVIYRARDTAFDREVAIKVLQDRFDVDSEVARRFREEARITGQLQHPGIPAVHRCGRLADGRPFLAMKLVKGRTLQDLLDERPGPAADRSHFLTVFEQVCHALAYAHARRVIHRDLKPANVMVGAFGEVQVMDWGLAKVLTEDQRSAPAIAEPHPNRTTTEIRSGREPDSATETGAIFGTPAFMSPEQAAGELAKIGPAGDVFGLGAILCVILTGRPPYWGPDAEAIRVAALRGKLEDAFAALDACGAEPEWIALAKRCLAPEPADRPPDAATVAAEVVALHAKIEQRARQAEMDRAEAAVREAERRKRRRIWGITAAGVIVLLLGVAGAALWAAGIFRLQRNSLDVARRDATEKLWRSKLEEARAVSLTRRPGQRENALALLREALTIAREYGLTDEDKALFRNVAIGCLTLPDVVEEKSWQGTLDPRGEWRATFDFDAALETYVRPDGEGNVAVHRVSDDHELAKIQVTSRLPGVYMSPSGKFVAVVFYANVFEKPTEISVYQLAAAGSAELIHKTPAYSTVAFRRDSREVAYVAADGRPAILDLESRQVRHLPATGQGLYNLSFSPNGDRICLHQKVDGKWTTQIRNSQTGQVLETLTPNGSYSAHAWHPDGRVLAYSSGDFIQLWDSTTRRHIGAFSGHKDSAITMAFDSSGELLFSNDWQAMLRVWDMRSGKQQLVLPARGTNIPIGKAPGQCVIADLADDRILRVLKVLTDNALREWPSKLPPAVGLNASVKSAKDNLMALSESSLPSKGFHIVQPETGKLLGAIYNDIGPVGFDTDGALYTVGALGACRWPRSFDAEMRTVRFGPPQVLLRERPCRSAGLSADGSVVAVATGKQATVIVHRNGKTVPVKSNSAWPYNHVAASPDGRYVVCGGGGGRQPVRIWDAGTGRLIRELHTDQRADPIFSPDGRWLWSPQYALRIWRAESWEECGDFKGNALTVSPQGGFCAIGEGVGIVRLVDIENRTELARLSVSENDRVFPKGFDADASMLYAWGQQTGMVYVWDLRLLREQLAELGLDWDSPRPSEAARPGEPISAVVFDTGTAFQNLDAERFLIAKKYKEAIVKLDESLAIDPKQADVYKQRAETRLALKQVAEAAQDFERYFKLKPVAAAEFDRAAWQIATVPGAPPQAYRPALDFANFAVRKEPLNQAYLIAKGAVLFRLGQVQEALAALRLAATFDLVGKVKHTDYIGYLMAMCLNRLAEQENREQNRRLAREAFDHAETARKDRKIDDPILTSLRREAEESLGP